jgi:Concanavalin A-like lectin/glucanases superfamily
MNVNRELSVAVLIGIGSLVGVAAASGQAPDGRGGPPPCTVRHGCVEHRSTALRFTDDGQYVLVPGTKTIDDITQELTLEAWVKPAPDLPQGYRSILSKQMNGSGYMLATNGDRFKAEVGGAQVTSGSQPATNGWQHIAAVWDSALRILKIYVNGQFDGALGTSHPTANTFELYIGSSPFGADTTWRGTIDEVRVWAVARTQDQIQSTMNSSLCGNEPGLRAYWSFDEGRGSAVRDSASRNDGVVSGPEWVEGVELLPAGDCGGVHR